MTLTARDREPIREMNPELYYFLIPLKKKYLAQRFTSLHYSQLLSRNDIRVIPIKLINLKSKIKKIYIW